MYSYIYREDILKENSGSSDPLLKQAVASRQPSE